MWLLCVKGVRNVAFVCERGQKMWLLCLKMRAQIWGCLGQMGHRRQIAQWSGTWTTHPGGTGFEPQGVALAVVVVRAGPLLQPGPG